ncbi:MAG: glycosyltransferase family 4 protein [Owenweeksia sp.]
MIRVLFVSRATLFTQAGGDTLQMEQTALYLEKENLQVTIYNGQNVREEDFDILHFFNIGRPADLIRFTDWAIPKVISAIYIDYTEYDQKHRNGFAGWLARIAGVHGTEYMKTIARGLKAKDRFPPLQYLLRGQKSSVKYLLKSCAIVITASRQEEKALRKEFGHLPQVSVIPLGSEHFPALSQTNTKRSGIVCAARIEGLKNQLNLIRALKGTAISLKLIGKSTANQPGYLEECKVLAEDSMQFTGPLTREELAAEFQKAKVHVLPSYYETTGLSTVEALKSGCQVVITKRGAQAEIFGDHAFYCDPDDPESIHAAIKKALDSHVDHSHWVQSAFSWVSAAKKISDIYRSLLQNS